jgi:hypothetical protein
VAVLVYVLLIVVAAGVGAAVRAGRFGLVPASYGGGTAHGWLRPAPSPRSAGPCPCSTEWRGPLSRSQSRSGPRSSARRRSTCTCTGCQLRTRPRSCGVPSKTTRPAVTQTASLSGVRVAVSVLRGYWSAALFGLAAVVLLVLGAPAKAALAGASFALVGAAVTRAIDLARERRAEAAQADANHRRDLDETAVLPAWPCRPIPVPPNSLRRS